MDKNTILTIAANLGIVFPKLRTNKRYVANVDDVWLINFAKEIINHWFDVNKTIPMSDRLLIIQTVNDKNYLARYKNGKYCDKDTDTEINDVIRWKYLYAI